MQAIPGKLMVAGLTLLLPGIATAANCPGTARDPRTFYISVNGNDANDGTAVHPFRTVQAGVDCASLPGDRVFLFGGRYTEFVSVVLKNGAPGKPIVIEGQPGIAPGPVAAIDGSITRLPQTTATYRFHEPNNNEWVCAPGQTTCKEYISSKPIPKPANLTEWFASRGSFVDPVNGRFARLILYSRREDLLADNETFDVIREGAGAGCPAADPRPGPVLGVSGGCTERRPWVYMGPGVWFDTATQHLHIRLSHTHNNVPGLADYEGPTNPNLVRLAIAEKNMKTLTVAGSNHIVFKNLAIRFAGQTLRVENCTDIVFDSVNVSAGQYGIISTKVTGMRFTNSIFDGGLPTWLFRGDIKDGYSFLENGQQVPNNLAKATMETLVLGGLDYGTEFDHCEFVNGHDLYLVGSGIRFHHNWIENLHDEALFLDAGVASGAIHYNVVTQTLSAISFAGYNSSGPWHIYRNLFDLRRRTAGYRPRNASFNRANVWRAGHPFKSNEAAPSPDGTPHSESAYDVFQNTFLVAFQADRVGPQPSYPQPLFNQMRASQEPRHLRRSFNNIFVMLNREPGINQAMAFMPPADFPADVDGNLYYGSGFSGRALFYAPVPPPSTGFKLFFCTMPDCLAEWHATPFFLQSMALRPPGFEAHSILLKDPQFTSWTGEEAPSDDFRLAPGSIARGAGIALPGDLRALDTAAPLFGTPDIGCYQAQFWGWPSPQLRVGVRGRKAYPAD